MIDPKSLSVDYRDLLKIPIRDRMSLMQSTSGGELLEGLTPTQRAHLFPDYYKEALPDISGFTKAMSGGLDVFKSSPATGESQTYAPGGRSGRNSWRDDSAVRKSDERYVPAFERRLRKEHPEYFVQGSNISAEVPDSGKAFLDSLTSSGLEGTGESYNIIVGGRTFDDFSDHPRVFGVTTGAGPSSAAGRYQITKTTWDDYRKKYPGEFPDFSPANQDKMAWYIARDTYREKTGRDLQTDLDTKDPVVIGQVARTLSGRWSSLPGGVHEGRGAGNFVDDYLDRIKGIETAVAAIPDEPLNSDIRTAELDSWLATQTPSLRKEITAAINADIKRNGLDPIKKDIESYKQHLEQRFATVDENNRVAEEQDTVALTRKDPLDNDVKTALEYAASKNGVMVEVVSGGQMSIDEAMARGARKVGKQWILPNGEIVRTGSTRHDGGGAGDLKLYRLNDKGEKVYLNMNNDDDRSVMQSFVTDSVSAGMTGVGAGDGYMGPETLHIGKGKSASWGGASWIETARRRGEDNPIDIAAWKTERDKRIEEAKNQNKPVEPSPVSISKADATNMPANKPFSLAKGSRIDNMKQEIKKNADTASAITPKTIPQDNLQQPRDDRPPVQPPEPQDPAPGKTDASPQNQAAMTTGTSQPGPMSATVHSGVSHGNLTPSQLRAYYDRGENLHREATSYV